MNNYYDETGIYRVMLFDDNTVKPVIDYSHPASDVEHAIKDAVKTYNKSHGCSDYKNWKKEFKVNEGVSNKSIVCIPAEFNLVVRMINNEASLILKEFIDKSLILSDENGIEDDKFCVMKKSGNSIYIYSKYKFRKRLELVLTEDKKFNNIECVDSVRIPKKYDFDSVPTNELLEIGYDQLESFLSDLEELHNMLLTGGYHLYQIG